MITKAVFVLNWVISAIIMKIANFVYKNPEFRNISIEVRLNSLRASGTKFVCGFCGNDFQTPNRIILRTLKKTPVFVFPDREKVGSHFPSTFFSPYTQSFCLKKITNVQHSTREKSVFVVIKMHQHKKLLQIEFITSVM